jgi:hypothetical protein
MAQKWHRNGTIGNGLASARHMGGDGRGFGVGQFLRHLGVDVSGERRGAVADHAGSPAREASASNRWLTHDGRSRVPSSRVKHRPLSVHTPVQASRSAS